MRTDHNPYIVSFTGYSGSGKTTFIEKLIPHLSSRGLKVAVIKHDGHDFDIDKEGKDTYRFAAAGAAQVAIFSDDKQAVITENSGHTPDEQLDRIIKQMSDADIIIIEGFRESDHPKIGVSRKATGKGLSLDPDELIAVITDDEEVSHPHKFGFDDIKGVADLILGSCDEYEPSYEDFPQGLSVSEAIDAVLSFPAAAKEEYVSIEEASGRVLAEDITADNDFPPFRRSPLDGYAFRHIDTKGASAEDPKVFDIIEEIPAGKDPEREIGKGQAALIFTGAPVPEGADVIERMESVRTKDGKLLISREYAPDTNVVPVGEDYRKGELLLSKGTLIGPFEAGVLAMQGKARVKAYKKPVAAVLSTGSELVDVSEAEYKPGMIRNSSIYTIGAMAEEAGAEALNMGIVPDDETEIANAIRRACAGADIIFTTGGVSVGDYDLVIKALQLIGAKIIFWKVSMKPGMAFVFADYKGKPVMCLSGNPSAAAMTMTVLGKTMIRKLSGRKDAAPVVTRMELGADITKRSPGGRFIRGRVVIEDGKAIFMPNRIAGNGTTNSNTGSDSVGIIEAGSEPAKGDLIGVIYERRI